MTTTGNQTDREPRPLGDLSAFEDGDFNSLSSYCEADPQFDEARLRVRRKLATLAKTFTQRAKEHDLALDSRTSLHRPYQFNGYRVRRIWAYICRDKKAKTALRKVVGRDLAKDLDAAYRNAYLCLALEHDAIEVSLRIHADAWFDGQNLKKRVAKEGISSWLERLNRLDGYFLRLADWKGEWRCGSLAPEQLEEFLRYYTPGEHALAIERRYPAPSGARDPYLTDEVPTLLLAELEALTEMYRYAAWSSESDFLFS